MGKLAQQLGGQSQVKVAPKGAAPKKDVPKGYMCGGAVKKGKK